MWYQKIITWVLSHWYQKKYVINYGIVIEKLCNIYVIHMYNILKSKTKKVNLSINCFLSRMEFNAKVDHIDSIKG
jgi:hypothetical protein